MPRSGGGIGMTRMIRALKECDLFDYECCSETTEEESKVETCTGMQCCRISPLSTDESSDDTEKFCTNSC